MEVVLRRLKALEEFKVNVVLERALLKSVISIKWITLLSYYIYRWFNTADSMEDNNDMPSASASETQPFGETGEEEEELVKQQQHQQRYQISRKSSETMTATV